jgi:hypothetical protein
MKSDPHTPEDEVYVFPMSLAQQRLWFLDQLSPNDISYNLPTAVRLRGPLDVAALERTLDEIVRRHEVLRTTFGVMDSQPVQIISPPVRLTLPVADLGCLTGRQQEAEAGRLANEEARLPFDLRRGPLMRARLLRLEENSHAVLLTMHHIVSDAWSKGLFIEEVMTLYEAFSKGKPSPLPPLAIQYADYSLWQREHLKGGTLERQLSYWKTQLAGAPPSCMPTDKPRLAATSQRGATRGLALPQWLSAAARRLSREEEATLFMTLLAAFKMLIHYYSGQHDIVIGTNIANRSRVETERLIGFFVNMLALRTDLSGNPSFREVVRRVREVTLSAYSNQDIPYERLVEEICTGQDIAHRTLFQVVFTLQNTPLQPLKLPSLDLAFIPIEDETTAHDLVLNLRYSEDGLGGSLTYNTELFKPSTISRLIADYEALLSRVMSNADITLSELERALLEACERDRLKQEQEFTETRRSLRGVGRRAIQVSN